MKTIISTLFLTLFSCGQPAFAVTAEDGSNYGHEAPHSDSTDTTNGGK